MAKKAKSSRKPVNGDNILYHILKNQLDKSDEAKFLVEQLILQGGVWFKPETYQEIPIFLPYVVRDNSCKKKASYSWGQANTKGFLKDDNTCIKDYLPSSITIQSKLPQLNGKLLGNGFVASHVWIDLQGKPATLHACNWECTNSFIPNLVWLPAQLSKLTDRNGSYAQQFIQHISLLLYQSVAINNPNLSPMLPTIWSALQDPGIKPISTINLDDLNYFKHNTAWVAKKKRDLNNELQSILNIIGGELPIVKQIKTSKYAPSLATVVKTMDPTDKAHLGSWITANM